MKKLIITSFDTDNDFIRLVHDNLPHSIAIICMRLKRIRKWEENIKLSITNS